MLPERLLERLAVDHVLQNDCPSLPPPLPHSVDRDGVLGVRRVGHDLRRKWGGFSMDTATVATSDDILNCVVIVGLDEDCTLSELPMKRIASVRSPS